MANDYQLDGTCETFPLPQEVLGQYSSRGLIGFGLCEELWFHLVGNDI